MFTNREEAALKLAQKLSLRLHSVAQGRRLHDVLVLGIPRGGVVTAYVVSKQLKAPLNVLVTRKIGAPNQPELAIGAVGPEGTLVLDKSLIKELGVEESWLKEEVKRKKEEVKEREKKFRKGKKSLNLKDKTVVVVDDGIATGATVEAALRYLKTKKLKKIVLAVPVASADSIQKLEELVDRVVVLETPPGFYAVGQFYEDFPQVTDEEVVDLLYRA